MYASVFEFVESVKASEFELDVFFSGRQQSYVIMLEKLFGEDEKPPAVEIERLKDLASRLLEGIPENPNSKETNTFNFGAVRGGFSFEYYMTQAGPKFVEGLIALDERQNDLNKQFEAIVEDEISEDPKVYELELERAKVIHRLSVISIELEARKDEIRQEKAGLRKSFIYLADERAL